MLVCRGVGVSECWNVGVLGYRSVGASVFAFVIAFVFVCVFAFAFAFAFVSMFALAFVFAFAFLLALAFVFTFSCTCSFTRIIPSQISR